MRFFLATVLLLFVRNGFAQNTLEQDDWLPYIENKLPTSFFTVEYDNMSQHTISSTSDLAEIGDGKANQVSNRKFSVALRFPIAYRKNLLMTGTVKFIDEEFSFSDGDIDYPLYVSLNNRNLKNLGGNINTLIKISDNQSLLIRTGLSLAGDFYRGGDYFQVDDLLKLSIAIGYGFKRDKNTYIAFGGYLGYIFGEPSIYPALMYTKQFNSNWSMEALLPQSVKAWRRFSENFYAFGYSRITGNSYTIRLANDVLQQIESLQLRRSNVISTLGIYHKINKWVWMKAEAGYALNLNFNISETNFISGSTLPKPDTDYLIQSDVSGAPYFGVSLFLSPPKELIKKILKAKGY